MCRARCSIDGELGSNSMGLKTHGVLDTLKDTGESLIEFGVIKPAMKNA